ncbi:DMT family transporter [Salmonella enterica]|uniref:DMT family transporter n=1 Tax=Salmonella enterica TaxID=28901 RepID=UPI0009B0C929|nr:DMT family transporter [Salmonella enterica]WGI48907.1 DMT family transporter [Salmonella enterica subsp. diarizonae serovar 48:i:z]
MSSSEISRKTGFMSAFGAATLMGFVGFFSRHINAQGDVIAFSRMLCGAVLFFFILLKLGRLKDLRKYKLSYTMVLSGLFMGTCLSAYVAATQMTSIANAVFFIYIGPIVSSVLAVIFLREKMKSSTLFAVIAVFAGMLLVVGIVRFSNGSIHVGLSFSPKTLTGDVLALLSGVGYGLFLFFGRYRTEVPGDVRSFWNFIFALAGIFFLFLFTHPSVSQMTFSDWMWWLGIGIVCGFGALSLCTIATRHLQASEFACVSYWECVVAVLFGYFIFSEPLSLPQAIGGALIIVGGVSEVLFSIVLNKSHVKENSPG